jgi:TatD DNase family protein
MGLIDSHAHLTYPELSGRLEGVLARCEQPGVERVITIGTDLEDAKRAIDLAARYPRRVHAAAGFHPHHADPVTDEDLSAMAQLWDDPRVVAFGEMGLDFHYNLAVREKQRMVFAGQLEIARDRHGPIIIHCREAFEDVVSMLLDHGFENRRVVFHCFTGMVREAQCIAEHGWRISFTGIVTFPKSDELQEIAKTYPLDRLMVETDSPYLSPVPVRGKKPNEPANVAHTARFLANLRGMSYDELVARTARNTREFFGFTE